MYFSADHSVEYVYFNGERIDKDFSQHIPFLEETFNDLISKAKSYKPS